MLQIATAIGHGVRWAGDGARWGGAETAEIVVCACFSISSMSGRGMGSIPAGACDEGGGNELLLSTAAMSRAR